MVSYCSCGSSYCRAKGKEKLVEAKKIHAEAEEAVSQMNIMITGMEGIAKMSDNYSSFIKKLNRMFAPFLQELERIKKCSSSRCGWNDRF